MNKLCAPLGKAVVVCFAADIVGSAFKLDVLCVSGDGREAIECKLSVGRGSFLAKPEKDSCRYRLIAWSDWRCDFGNLGNVRWRFRSHGRKRNYRQGLARECRAIIAVACFELAINPGNAVSCLWCWVYLGCAFTASQEQGHEWKNGDVFQDHHSLTFAAILLA
jgi:hypothetical protein